MLSLHAGDIISYLELCQREGTNLQRGMNFRLNQGLSVILMSVRSDAPYSDRIEDNGMVLIYEGHDRPRQANAADPKTVDQPEHFDTGKLTQNGLFYEAARLYKLGKGRAELVRVYEKVRSGIWVYNGLFRLADAWKELSGGRLVFKFRLELSDDQMVTKRTHSVIDHTRMIPSSVKLQVWKRDEGRCVLCASRDNLHFDHIIPFSKGGSSLLAENIQLLCARHNLEKHDNIV